MSGFGVSSQELEGHLPAVKQVDLDLKGCKQAADQVGYGGFEAYGLFLQMLIPPVLEMCLGDTTKLIDEAATLAQAFHKGVEANNACYLATEDAIKEMWDGAQNDGLFE